MKLRSTFAALTAAFGLFCAPLSASAQEADALPTHVTDFALVEATDDHVIGSETAAISLIIWASVTCPHCSNWFNNEWPIIKSELVETGKLRVIFRPFPTAPGNLAMTGFRLAECAPTEDYMSIIEFQMKEQQNILDAAENGSGDEAYKVIAEIAGMATDEAIATCFRNPDITAHIIDNVNRAKIADVRSVPAFLINGQRYTGASDAKSLTALINKMDEAGLSELPKDVKQADPHAGHEHD